MMVGLPAWWGFDSLPGRFLGFGCERGACGRWVGVGFHVSVVLVQGVEGAGQDAGDRGGFWCVFGDEEPGSAGVGDEFPCGREEPVPPPFHVPPLGSVAGGQCCQLQPGKQVHGQGRNIYPSLVSLEIVEGQLAEACVL